MDKTAKQEAAQKRQEIYDALTIPERIAKLDEKLGVGQGAVKERRILQKKLEGKWHKPEPKPAQPVQEAPSQEENQ